MTGGSEKNCEFKTCEYELGKYIIINALPNNI